MLGVLWDLSMKGTVWLWFYYCIYITCSDASAELEPNEMLWKGCIIQERNKIYFFLFNMGMIPVTLGSPRYSLGFFTDRVCEKTHHSVLNPLHFVMFLFTRYSS